MKKRRLKLLSLFLAASLAVPASAGSMQLFTGASIEAKAAQQGGSEVSLPVYLEDGVNDAWGQDKNSVVGTDAVCQVEDGWLHLKSGTGNGNNPGTQPAIFVHPGTFNFNADGYFEFIKV